MMYKRLALLGVIFAAALVPHLTDINYFIHLAVLAMIFMIVAQGANVIQGYTGYVSIAQGAFMGVGAYTSALLTVKAGWPVWLALGMAPLASVVAALICGYPSLRVRGHYFAIVTLAINMVVFTVLINWMSLTGGEPGLPGIPAPESITVGEFEYSFQKRRNFYYLALASLIVSTALAAALVHSRVGRVLQAIRQNETFTEAAGISCWRYKLFAFVFSAALAGFAGGLYAHYMGFINPSPFSADTSLNTILAVILGGSGTLSGPIIGAALTVLLPEMLRVAEIYRLIVYGVLLIVVMIFMPRGLVPPLVDLVRRRFAAHRG